MFDPDGDLEEFWPDDYEPDPAELVGGHLVTPEAQIEEARAMAAAATPGGLIGTPPAASASAAAAARTAPAFGGSATASGGADALSERPVNIDVGLPGVVDTTAGGGEGVAERGGVESRGGIVRSRKFFGLPYQDEWISAASNRIEKLNSRAPWKYSWTEQVGGIVGGEVALRFICVFGRQEVRRFHFKVSGKCSSFARDPGVRSIAGL